MLRRGRRPDWRNLAASWRPVRYLATARTSRLEIHITKNEKRRGRVKKTDR